MADDATAAALAGGLQNLATNGALLNQNISRLIQAIEAVFPQATSQTSTTATGGSETLPANPAGFIIVNIGGTPVKLPYYNV